MKVLVCGSRTWEDRFTVHGALDTLAAALPPGEKLTVVNGFAYGADRTADEWASEHGRPWRFAAKWDVCDHGRAASAAVRTRGFFWGHHEGGDAMSGDNRSTYVPPNGSVTIPVHHSTSVPGTTFGGAGTGDVASAMALQQAAQNPQLCAAGFHAWVPWLKLEGSWVTWCCRLGCDHSEQYDVPATEPVALRCSWCGHWEKGQRSKAQVADWMRVHRVPMLGPYDGTEELASTCPEPCGPEEDSGV